MISAFFDTNVLASAIGAANPTTAPVELLRLATAAQFRLIISEFVVAELTRTLGNRYFRARVTEDQSQDAIAALRRTANIVDVTAAVSGIASHPEDDLILAAAISGRVDYLVTGDARC